MSAEPRTVLVTNDDGSEARGLAALRGALLEEGLRVVVVAPDGNRSATGHAVTCRGQLLLTRTNDDDDAPLYQCSGSPADCVRVGLLSRLLPRPDLVVSGINHGVNLGDDVHYSGTVAAAVEAAFLGVPAIAASQHGDDVGLPFITSAPREFPHAHYVARLARWAAEGGLQSRHLLNVNLPSETDATRVELTRLGRRRWEDVKVTVEPVEEGSVLVAPWSSDPPYEARPGTDFAAVADGVGSVTLLTVEGGLTDLGPGGWDELKGIDLQLGRPRPEGTKSR